MSASGKKTLAWSLIAVLAVVHYDWWLWYDDGVVFGFMPVGLAYQAMISLGAGIAWALVVRWAWPVHVEKWASGGDPEGEDR